jgi:hypothetical protein
MRRVSSQLCGATPMVRRKAREKWLTDKRQLPRYVFERHTTVEVGAENFFGASLLPRGEPAPRRVRHRPHAAIGLSDMNPDRQGDVINKQPVG